MKRLPQPWTAAMEAAVFTTWIYDRLQPHGAALKVAYPLILRAIAAAKKKNDNIDVEESQRNTISKLEGIMFPNVRKFEKGSPLIH
jgi:hypothetical protein